MKSIEELNELVKSGIPETIELVIQSCKEQGFIFEDLDNTSDYVPIINWLDKHGIKYFDNSIGIGERLLNAVNLQSIYIDNDIKIEGLPESICKLVSLDTIYSDNNHLTSLPESLGRLDRLVWLPFSCNGIKTLPESLIELSELKVIDLRENPLDLRDVTTLNVITTLR